MKKIIIVPAGCLILLLIRANFINEQEMVLTTITTSTTLMEEKSIEIMVLQDKLAQGDTLVVKAENLKTGQKIIGEFDQQEFDFIPTEREGKFIGIVGIDVRKTPGDYPLKVLINNEEKLHQIITIKKGNFYVAKFVLTPELKQKGYTQANIVQNIGAKDGVLIKQVVSQYTPTAYFKKSFVNPLDKIIKIGDFGTTRIEGDIALRHLGVDLDAKINTPVYAINGGVVRFAQELTEYGKTIIIDHGVGIFSLYLHLNEFKVTTGDYVTRGDIIGLSGNTGYSLEPHLHYLLKPMEPALIR